jgi:hypothetical protein
MPSVIKDFSCTMTVEKAEREFKAFVYSNVGNGVSYAKSHEGYLEGFKDGKLVAKFNRSRTVGVVYT